MPWILAQSTGTHIQDGGTFLLSTRSADRPKTVQVDARMSDGGTGLYPGPVAFPTRKESPQALDPAEY